MDEQKSALESAKEFIRQRDEYKTRLQDELKAARARVAEIESVLRELSPPEFFDMVNGRPVPSETVVHVAASAEQRRPETTKGTIPDHINAVLREHSGGMTSGEIVRAVSDRHELPKTTVFPTIYRMEKDGRLRKRGDKYFLSE